jgi:nickel-dependent lactate racemase
MDFDGQILSIPYGEGLESCSIAKGRKVTILSARRDTPKVTLDEKTIIERALAEPISSPTLFELAKGKQKVVLLTSDHTRPVPSRLTLPSMLSEIRRASPLAQTTILIGVGCHRASSKEEIIAKFGADLASSEQIVNHDPLDENNLVSLGRLPSGGNLRINRLAVEADLLVADGFIEPHQFAGFSGGRKSVLPGVAAFKSVLASHNAEFTVHPKARPGSLEGNPFQIDMVYAARKAGLAFIVNVTLTPEKKVSAAFAGDMEAAHLAGCRYTLDLCGVEATPAPIVITSNGGYPLDQNLYQATKSIMAADLTCADGGVIVAVNECRDGHGSQSFIDSFINSPSLDALLAQIEARGREETIADQWVVQLTASILKRRRVIIVTKAPRQALDALGLIWAATLEEGLKLAEDLVGHKLAPITVLPDAVAVVIR